MALITGCTTLPIDTTHTSKSQDSRAQFLILHYTAGDFPGSLKILTEGPVSSHYLVDTDPPTIYRLVDETRRAYHAGASHWKGHTHLNASSIGIEIVNRGFRDGPEGRVWFEYPEAQIQAVLNLVQDIVARHEIRGDRILGHSDIAPLRKTDPGPKFPWKRLADLGLIPWPDPNKVAERLPAHQQQLPDVLWFQDRLANHGFTVGLNGELDAPTRAVLAAFQMKYRPAKHDGMPDAETAAILEVMTQPERAPANPAPTPTPAPMK